MGGEQIIWPTGILNLMCRIECRQFPKSVKCMYFLKGILLQKVWVLLQKLCKLHAILQELRAPSQQQNMCAVTKSVCVYLYTKSVLIFMW